MSKLDEFALIQFLNHKKQSEELQQKLGVIKGIGDDAAVVQHSPGSQLVMTCDTMVETIHFNPYTMLDEDVGYKALASNLSDIAAMGAVPKHALISLSIPKHYSSSRLKKIYKGLYECANEFEVAIIGGDTSKSPKHLNISVTLTGEVETNQALLRSNAKVNDLLFVTGFLGCSAAGLHYLLEKQERHLTSAKLSLDIQPLVQAHRRPIPQMKAGRLLLESKRCHSLNDISDGLASEAHEISEASKVGILINEDMIPIHPTLRAYCDLVGKSPLDWILYGGEDYHLLGTVSRSNVEYLQSRFQRQGIPFFILGEVIDQKGVHIKDQYGNIKKIQKEGYNHFN
ncbi:thiamine-phosphate kinase [Chengkuizengella axinellae]|uniref:Thiamine-monophosphate kinase n=1 Tax=Chengkuizengella axinellae TaxID=3064388 RepID=A0ABT9J4U7_9BACL|nr:thiamine-phosphate kinase [Chengkuizengella sp. 2205SS18-9]MDP5276656.1 thiamine-phosphate kinase [Chengkuizengella sp. 2205SS18-9]